MELLRTQVTEIQLVLKHLVSKLEVLPEELQGILWLTSNPTKVNVQTATSVKQPIINQSQQPKAHPTTVKALVTGAVSKTQSPAPKGNQPPVKSGPPGNAPTNTVNKAIPKPITESPNTPNTNASGASSRENIETKNNSLSNRIAMFQVKTPETPPTPKQAQPVRKPLPKLNTVAQAQSVQDVPKASATITTQPSGGIAALKARLLAPKEFVSSRRQDVAELEGVVCVKDKVDLINKQLSELKDRFANQAAAPIVVATAVQKPVVDNSKPKFSLMYRPEQNEIQSRGTFLNFWTELSLAHRLIASEDYDAAEGLLAVINEKHQPLADEHCKFAWNTAMLCSLNNRQCTAKPADPNKWVEIKTMLMNVGLAQFKKFEMEFAYHTILSNAQFTLLIGLVDSKSFGTVAAELEVLVDSVNALKRIKGSTEIDSVCSIATICFVLHQSQNSISHLEMGRRLLEGVPLEFVPDDGIKILGAIYYELAVYYQSKQDYTNMESVINLAINLPTK